MRPLSIALMITLLAGINVRSFAEGNAVRVIPESLDLGELWQGEKVEKQFTVRNEGSEEIELLEAKSNCGCTIISLAEEKLPPGGQTNLKVTFHAFTQGAKTWRLFLPFCGDKANGSVVVRVDAQIKQAYIASVHWINIGDSSGLSSSNLTDISANGDQVLSFQVTAFRKNDPNVESLNEKSIRVESSIFVPKDMNVGGHDLPGAPFISMKLYPRRRLLPGLYKDKIKCLFGQMEITKDLEFSVNGTVWPEKYSYNLGVLRGNAETVADIHLRSVKKYLPIKRVFIKQVTPQKLANAVSVHGEVSRSEDVSIVRVIFNPARDQINGFFQMEVVLGVETNSTEEDVSIYLFGLVP